MNKLKTNKYSPEVRERAVRMVQEHRGEYSSPWAAVESIAPKIGCSPHTLHEWVERGPIFWTGKLMLIYQLVRRVHETHTPPYFHGRI